MLRQMTSIRFDPEHIEEAGDSSTSARQITSLLGKAITTGQVAARLVEGGTVAGGAASGALVLFTDSRCELRVVHAAGAVPPPARFDRTFPLNASFPLVDAVRLRQE